MARKHGRLGTPRAAGIAGVVFALLMAAAMILVRLALPGGAGGAEVAVDAGQRSAVRTALALLPFAGISFLWFMGALREQAGEGEDRFVSTVFMGSGLVFVAMLFGSAAAAGTVLDESQQDASFGRLFAHTLLTTYGLRMAAVFIFTTSTIGRRLGVFPRPLVVLGYLAGLTLLVVGADLPWSELVFPAWALIVSLNILLGRRPADSPPAAVA
ncbi:hypothetical protein SSP24_74890 [Streptomyces spinoverrucosus]|uniref:DUF4386 domain-containing protein n=1 Tax=Streptomyces spinoverrucosus TaxID=284043 RepID=A0A4Y3VSA1_9ACTN|nr:hypothetical protein [Streptomyces spinoverrucosus]GEC09834.1 hypothetical protein SSP24_74890 [Streptomyces spinoverrucosus]GHB97450.1 hypothetical protein GCM10010397_82540 [Streptomyces spinoverrucosus]